MIDAGAIVQIASHSVTSQTVEREAWEMSRTVTAPGQVIPASETCLVHANPSLLLGGVSLPGPPENQAFEPPERAIPRDATNSLDRSNHVAHATNNEGFQRGWAVICEQLVRVEVEPGMAHAAEPMLDRQLLQFGDIRVLAALKTAPPGEAAALVLLLGRISHVTGPVRIQLVRWALGSAEPTLRDAAIQASESWADQRLVKTLRGHRDPLPWLQAYAAGVANDLDRL